MTIWFTGCTHFGHERIIDICKRPYDSGDEMDKAMIANYNSVVRPTDVVYHLGDVTLGRFEMFEHYINQLNGEILIVPGNHDHRWLSDFRHNPISRSNISCRILPPLLSASFNIPSFANQQIIVLCHYAQRTWDRAHYNAWHLHSHSHGRLPSLGLSFDVGVDCWDYTPISLDTVVQKMNALMGLKNSDIIVNDAEDNQENENNQPS